MQAVADSYVFVVEASALNGPSDFIQIKFKRTSHVFINQIFYSNSVHQYTKSIWIGKQA